MGSEMCIRDRDWQYGHGVPMVRSSDCFTRLRVMATSPKSLNCRTLDGARSLRSASSSACMTFWRLRRSSMSMKSITMMPPRSRNRIWRTISLIASTLVLTIVSSSRVVLPTYLPVLTSIATSASVWLMTIEPPDFR